MTNKEKALSYLYKMHTYHYNEMYDLDKCIFWIKHLKDVDKETTDQLQKAYKQLVKALETVDDYYDTCYNACFLKDENER